MSNIKKNKRKVAKIDFKIVPKYSLRHLLKQCDPKAPQPKYDKEWENIQPVGKEVW